MFRSLPIRLMTTDAAGVIPPRLGIAAVTAGFVGTGGQLVVPVIALPSWIPVVAGGVSAEPDMEPMSLEETHELMQLDEAHNPLLAELWRGDDLVDNP